MKKKAGILLVTGIFIYAFLNRKKIIKVFTSDNEFIKQMLPYALAIESKFKIPHLFLLAQTGLETGFGKHLPGYNFAGLKAVKDALGNPQEPAQLLWTWEYLNNRDAAAKFPERDASKDVYINGKWKVRVKDWFKKYDSLQAGLNGYISVLMKPRYKAAFNYSEPLAFAAEIKKGGYATDPNYVAKIEKNINYIKNII